MQGKEDEEKAEDNAEVQPRGKKIVVAHPPPEVVASHEPLEDESDYEPRREVEASKRRDGVETDQGNGDVDIAPGGSGVAASKEVERDGSKSADNEEPHEGIIAKRASSVDPHHRLEKKCLHSSCGENSLRADSTPKNRGRVEHIQVRADKAGLLMR